MNICPTHHRTARRLQGDTPYGSYTIELYRDHDGPVFDADGEQLGTVKLVMKEPPLPACKVLTAEQKQRMAQRRAVCETCDKAKGFTVVGVKCKKCKTCQNNLSLIGETSTCPLNRWPV